MPPFHFTARAHRHGRTTCIGRAVPKRIHSLCAKLRSRRARARAAAAAVVQSWMRAPGERLHRPVCVQHSRLSNQPRFDRLGFALLQLPYFLVLGLLLHLQAQRKLLCCRRIRGGGYAWSLHAAGPRACVCSRQRLLYRVNRLSRGVCILAPCGTQAHRVLESRSLGGAPFLLVRACLGPSLPLAGCLHRVGEQGTTQTTQRALCALSLRPPLRRRRRPPLLHEVVRRGARLD
eukprot:scaffold61882_cov58-Phaeocystis_antarctica.AAC.2